MQYYSCAEKKAEIHLITMCKYSAIFFHRNIQIKLYMLKYFSQDIPCMLFFLAKINYDKQKKLANNDFANV